MKIRKKLIPSDCFFLYAWRRLADVKRWSIKDPPEWAEHLLYFEDLLNAQEEGKIQAYVAEIGDQVPAGVLIISGNEVNIMVSGLHRRKGVARNLLNAAQRDLDHLIAHVVIGNTVALKLFSCCGFTVFGGEERQHKACCTLLWVKEAK